jgi:hypothetical protein
MVDNTQETHMHHSTGHKTPFEVRLELLQMAKDHLDATFKAQLDFATMAFGALVTANKATMDEVAKLLPQPYNMTEVIARAAELNAFVCKKD